MPKADWPWQGQKAKEDAYYRKHGAYRIPKEAAPTKMQKPKFDDLNDLNTQKAIAEFFRVRPAVLPKKPKVIRKTQPHHEVKIDFADPLLE